MATTNGHLSCRWARLLGATKAWRISRSVWSARGLPPLSDNLQQAKAGASSSLSNRFAQFARNPRLLGSFPDSPDTKKIDAFLPG